MISENPKARLARSRDERLFSRITGARAIEGNSVRLLKDGAENYTRWLEAIQDAESHIYFENYYVKDDAAGKAIADALIDRARGGVRVYVLYDWLGNLWLASRAFWARLRSAGVEVRAYNPPDLLRPFSLLSRDHRKMLLVDNKVGFVTGLCVGQEWLGDEREDVEAWRDTGVEIHGPALSDIEIAFARSWSAAGEPLSEFGATPSPTGTTRVRIVASDASTTGMLRLDELVAGMAEERLYLTDSYYGAINTYEEALIAAAKDGVDVRLLSPGKTDLPLLRPFSLVRIRTLLQAGVRVYQWNGPMLHAKSAVADGRWSRVGSTNLNLASWIGNRELDAVIEDEDFGAQMEAMFIDDLEHSTELSIGEDGVMRPTNSPQPAASNGPTPARSQGPREAAARLGRFTRATVTNQRDLTPGEARFALGLGFALAAVAIGSFIVPRPLAFIVSLFLLWMGVSVLGAGVRRLIRPRGST